MTTPPHPLKNGRIGRRTPHNFSKILHGEEGAELAEKAGAYLIQLPETIAYFTGAVYTGHSIKKKDDEWLLIVRIQRKKRHLVCFVNGPSPAAVWRDFGFRIVTYSTEWREDRFANGS